MKVMLTLLACGFFAGRACAASPSAPGTLVLVSPGLATAGVCIARVNEKLPGAWNVLHAGPSNRGEPPAGRQIWFGQYEDFAGIPDAPKWERGTNPDEYSIRTVGDVVYIAGGGPRGVMYGIYAYAEGTGRDESAMEGIRHVPAVPRRYAWVDRPPGTDHQAMLFFDTLKELPKYGFNGIFIRGYDASPPPGFDGPRLGLVRRGEPAPDPRDDSPAQMQTYWATVAAAAPPSFATDPAQLREWKSLAYEIRKYGFEICVAIPPVMPLEYPEWQITLALLNMQRFEHLDRSLRAHFRAYLARLSADLPDIDAVFLASTEGLSVGPQLFSAAERGFLFAQRPGEPSSRFLGSFLDELSAWSETSGRQAGVWSRIPFISADERQDFHAVVRRFPRLTLLEDAWLPVSFAKLLPPFGHLPSGSLAGLRNPLGVLVDSSSGAYSGARGMLNLTPAAFARVGTEAVERRAEMTVMRVNETGAPTLFEPHAIHARALHRATWSLPVFQGDLWTGFASSLENAEEQARLLKCAETVQTRGFALNDVPLLPSAAGEDLGWNPPGWLTNADLGPTAARHTSAFLLFRKPGTPLLSRPPSELLAPADLLMVQIGGAAVSIADFRTGQLVARSACGTALSEIEAMRTRNPSGDFRQLEDAFRHAAILLEAISLLGEAAYATNLMLENYDGVDDVPRLFDTTCRRLERPGESLYADATLRRYLTETAQAYRQFIRQRIAPVRG